MAFTDWQIWQVLIAAAVGTVTIFVGIRTLFWRRMQMRSWIQADKFQSDSHILELCKVLSNPSQRMQLAAAALLFDRLTKRSGGTHLESERSAIVQALLAATIDDARDGSTGAASRELSKYIADSVVKHLGAVAAGKRLGESTLSPLTGYYWQRVRLTGAYWADVDARGIDFFGANFDGASLRRGHLRKAILREASLKQTVLIGADLRDADLREADLQNAELNEASLSGARYSAGTVFPSGFNPIAAGMKLIETPPIFSR